MRRALLGVALAALTLAPIAEALDAQTPAGSGRFPRRYLFTLIGAAVGSAVGGSYVAFQGQQQPGNCAKPGCVVTVTVTAGLLVGYMIGREFDELHALRYRGGAPLDPKSIAAGLRGDPTLLSVEDDLVAVGGSSGIELFRSTGSELRPSGRRAGGVRGISALDLAQPGALALGSITGLYIFPPREGPGALVRPGEIGATITTADRVFIASGSMVESAPLSADTSRQWPGVDVGARVNDLEVDLGRNLVWALTDSAIVALRIAGDSLEVVGTSRLEFRGRKLAVEGTRLAVAFGEQGVAVYDGSDPTAIGERGSWGAARFVYDVSLAGTRMFVAAGPEGLYVLDISADPVVLGLARELGFAAAVASFGSYTYILDRSTNSVRRIDSEFE
jgi:hypothetical protein